ncbi:uncharacterized protein si:ch211-140l13.3 [Centropristis striata]|uniref:uncharacterized protein si:ch211-140l13.3 n=1 Tax=Centropristis striata TaxID=184440 RepID=UPI0027E0C2C3|nr:uncharacterized protein si:ch211-140l13.3 [Centropristis striata]
MHQISEPKHQQSLRGRTTEGRHFVQECEDISTMDKNNVKVCDQQEVQRRASLSPQRPGGKLTSDLLRRSSAPSTVFKDEGTQLETIQALTSQPEYRTESGTLRESCSGSCSPQTPRIQAQAKVFSRARSQEQTPLVPRPETPPFQEKQIAETRERGEKTSQLRERNSREESHLEEKEIRDNTSETCRINQSLCEPTPSVSMSVRERRAGHGEVENMSTTAGRIAGEDKVKGQFKVTAPRRETSSCGATSDHLWEQSHAWIPKYPSSAYESTTMQHFNISPALRDNRASPRAWGNQEVIVSFKSVNGHMERVSSSDMETLSTGCDETKTHFHLCQCSTGSNWVRGQKQATTTAAAAAAFCFRAPSNTSQVPTPPKGSTFPMHSTTRSSTGAAGGREDGDNPTSQCHHFPKLPSPPPNDSHSNLSQDGCASEAEDRWMFCGIQKQDQSLGSGVGPQQSSVTSSSTNDQTQGDSGGHFGGEKRLTTHSVKPERKPDGTKMAKTSSGFLRDAADQKDELQSGCSGDNIISDRDESRGMRKQLHEPETRAVQALRQQMEALQQQFRHRERDWSEVRHQLEQLIRENSELRKKLTVVPQCHPVAAHSTAPTHAALQEGQTESFPAETEQLLSDGCSSLTLTDQKSKATSADQKTKTVTFSNGDVKHILEDGKVVYYYAGSQTTHTTHPSGLEVLHFLNKQIEKRLPGGRREILFPDHTIKYVEADGSQRTIFPDGTIVHLSPSGEKMIDFPNGQREIHTSQYKRREYPDGTVKTIFPSGRQETKYASGRVRTKDRVKFNI